MKYMLLLYGEAGAGPAPGTPEFGEMLQEYGAATDAMRKAGALLDEGLETWRGEGCCATPAFAPPTRNDESCD